MITERTTISYLIFKMNQEKKVLEKRWRGDMPDIPLGEYRKIEASLIWLHKQMATLLHEEYGHPERGEL